MITMNDEEVGSKLGNGLAITRRDFIKSATGLVGSEAAVLLPGQTFARPSENREAHPGGLMGNRFLTLNSVIRTKLIEYTRYGYLGKPGEWAYWDTNEHFRPEYLIRFRDAIAKGWPGGRITWSLSWGALFDERPNFVADRKLMKTFHEKFGDEVTFIPGTYFANTMNSREQVNKDIHDALARVTEIIGNGYRPDSLVAGFLAAENQRYLAEVEGIHVCQGNIWSQYSIDSQDGEGSISYPYFPSKEHFCKPAQGKEDFIDCVNLDGWTVDFLFARLDGFDGGNSRTGVGPVETLRPLGHRATGYKEIMSTTHAHFDRGFELNGFAWVCNNWEGDIIRAEGYEIEKCLTRWLFDIRTIWPGTRFITQGEFGNLWRNHYKSNDDINYRFEERGSGVGASKEELEIQWFMNKSFRLALLRNWRAPGFPLVIDFTRYDGHVSEPSDTDKTRRWSLLGEINMKMTRPQDTPVLLANLPEAGRNMISERYPQLAELAGAQSLPKKNWKVSYVSSEEAGHEAIHAIDDNPTTYWRSAWPGHPHEIQIDLGEEVSMSGFLYLPPKSVAPDQVGLKFEFYVSSDGKQWGRPQCQGEFLHCNAPQSARWAGSVSGRYIRFVTLSDVDEFASVAELGVVRAG